MSTIRKLHLLMLCGLMASNALGQTGQPQAGGRIYEADNANVADAIAKVKSGKFVGADVDMIGRGGAVGAIPILEEQFVRSQDPLVEATIARVLVRLGDKNDTYWGFLVKLATPALESDAPDFINFDSRSGGGPSPAFVAWAKANGKSPESAGQNAMYWFPGRLTMLALTGDPRAIPLLRRGLLSPNHVIEIAAAEGLSELQDKDSIPLIIDACKRAPSGAAAVIAEPLVYFDDAEAQSAVDTYVPKEKAKILRDGKAQGKKTPLEESGTDGTDPIFRD